MKPFLAISLAFLYGVLTLSQGLQFHMCGTKNVQSIVYQMSEEDGCHSTSASDHSCCSSKEKENSSSKNDCCKDVQFFLNDLIDAVTISFPSLEVSDVVAAVFSKDFLERNDLQLLQENQSIPTKDKTDHRRIPIWKSLCSLVFYA